MKIDLSYESKLTKSKKRWYKDYCLKNFSFHKDKNEPVYSDSLCFDGMKWKLRIYPNGNHKTEGNLSAYVEVCDGLVGSAEFKYEIELKNQVKSKNIKIFGEENFRVSKYIYKYCLHNLSKLEEDGFLVDNQISFRFVVEYPSLDHRIKILESNLNKSNIRWDKGYCLKNFSFHKDKNEPVYSDPLCFDGMKWKLKICPNGDEEEGKYLSAYVGVCDGLVGSAEFKYEIELINQTKSKNIERFGRSNFIVSGNYQGRSFHDLSKLEKDGFLVDDQISFRFAVEYPSVDHRIKILDQALSEQTQKQIALSNSNLALDIDFLKKINLNMESNLKSEINLLKKSHLEAELNIINELTLLKNLI